MATATTETLAVPKRTGKPTSRVVFTEGGKGGVGKTAFSSLLVEWYARLNTAHALLDLDTENKSRGSLLSRHP
jgi:MinD-like ATPase involved in chromosome partitioning or flagellar assembly